MRNYWATLLNAENNKGCVPESSKLDDSVGNRSAVQKVALLRLYRDLILLCICNKGIAQNLRNYLTFVGWLCQIGGQHMNALKWATTQVRNSGGQTNGGQIPILKGSRKEDWAGGRAGERETCRLGAKD